MFSKMCFSSIKNISQSGSFKQKTKKAISRLIWLGINHWHQSVIQQVIFKLNNIVNYVEIKSNYPTDGQSRYCNNKNWYWGFKKFDVHAAHYTLYANTLLWTERRRSLWRVIIPIWVQSVSFEGDKICTKQYVYTQ